MSFEIPEPFVWDESFRVFYEKLDEEHKGLFKYVFDVAASNDGGSLCKLCEGVKAHFATEEGMMQAKNYPDFASHKKAHDDFVAKISGLSAPLSTDTLHFAKDWLVTHIKKTDFQYKGKL